MIDEENPAPVDIQRIETSLRNLQCFHHPTLILSDLVHSIQMLPYQKAPHKNARKRWDLIDVDCDGCEVTLMSELVALALRVRRVHLSTHSREIHQLVLGFLKLGSIGPKTTFLKGFFFSQLPVLTRGLTKRAAQITTFEFSCRMVLKMDQHYW